MAMIKALFPSQYLSMHIISSNIGQNGISIQVSCTSFNKWAVQEDLLRATSNYNKDGFNSTKFTQLVKDVKYALRTKRNDNLALVDTLQRMGIEHHFQEEIQSILQKEYEESTCFLKYQTHHDVSLCFRLLRQEGYHVSADVFKKFKNNDDGTFGLNLSQDVNGLIGLYEASQLGVEGEHILDEIANFSSEHLNACLDHNDSCDQARIIKKTLNYPYHKSLASYKAKSFINNFIGINGWERSTLQELANIDHSITKEIHQHELIQFSRWELDAMMELPEYMRSPYKALYDTINDIGYNIYKIYGQNPTQNLRYMWTNLCNAFLKEAKWFASKELPTADEYLKNGLISSGVHVVLVHMFYLLGFGLTNKNSIYLEDSSAMASSVAMILRLWDDLGSAKDENQEGNDGSYIKCYMKENKDASIELAREYVFNLIEDEWKQLNKEHLHLMSRSLGSFSKASLNIARMVPLMYNYDDKQSLYVLQEYINSMLYDNISMSMK